MLILINIHILINFEYKQRSNRVVQLFYYELSSSCNFKADIFFKSHTILILHKKWKEMLRVL